MGRTLVNLIRVSMAAKKRIACSQRTATLQALALRAGQGDESAFAELHARLEGGLKRFFFQRTGGGGDLIEELAQRTWVEAWRSLKAQRYDGGRAAFSTYLYGIGYKLLLRHRSALGRLPGTSLSLEESAFAA